MGANAQTAVPVFTAGQVLTAAQQTEINTGIPVFATTVTRDAAFGGAGEKTLAEGQFAYIEATNATQFYDGAAWQAFGGKILQVVGATSSTNVSTSSTSYVTSGLAATITPSLTSSKILIIVSTTIYVANANGSGDFTLFRGTVAGTNLATGSAAMFGTVYTRDTTYGAGTAIFLDSPNTTSATTYTLGIKAESGANTIRAQAFDRTGQIVLMEVGA